MADNPEPTFPAHSAFAPQSHFTNCFGPPEVRENLLKTVFASTEPAVRNWQGDVAEIKTGQLRSWWHDIDDALVEIEDGSMRGLERAVRQLEELKEVLDDVVRSTHAQNTQALPSDRPAG